MNDLHIPAKTETVNVCDVMKHGGLELALAIQLGTNINKIKIYSISENPSKLAYDIVYKEDTNEM